MELLRTQLVPNLKKKSQTSREYISTPQELTNILDTGNRKSSKAAEYNQSYAQDVMGFRELTRDIIRKFLRNGREFTGLFLLEILFLTQRLITARRKPRITRNSPLPER